MAEIVFSAKFKRDYVAALAVILFFMIVLGEIALAISIPLYLQGENALALQVQRVQMLEEFDAARDMVPGIKPVNDAAAAELRLVSWNLNLLANYLRGNAGKLNGDEIAELRNCVKNMVGLLLALRDQNYFCKSQVIDTSFYINAQIPKTI